MRLYTRTTHPPTFTPVTSRTGTLSVAVVIPCHNYGRFLEECVQSVRAQSYAVTEIVIVDDSSTDETSTIADALGVRCVRIESGSIWEARHAGYQATTADVLCFLDADDMLSQDYLAEAVQILESDWRVGIVYSDFEKFGSEAAKSNFPDKLSPLRLQRSNCCHAGSVVRRSALAITDAFHQPPPSEHSHEDWWLWRLLVEAGWQTRKQTQLYHYRRHANGSMITSRIHHPLYERQGLAKAEVSILTPLSGRYRTWPQLSNWYASQTWPREQCQLFLLDTSDDPDFREMVRNWGATCDYPDVRIRSAAVGPRGLADEPRARRPELVQQAVLRCWRQLTAGLTTPWALLVEDDVIPHDDVIERLLKKIDTAVDAVSSPYPARAGGMITHGFGCLLVRSPLLRSHVWTHGPTWKHWYDPWFASKHHLLVDHETPADHLLDERQVTCA